MKIIDNRSSTVTEDLTKTLVSGSTLSVAAACFSMYAFEELKSQMSEVSEFRFLFTAPLPVGDVSMQGKRDARRSPLTQIAEETIAGTAFEAQIKNTMRQKAIAKECAEWIKQGKVSFRASSRSMIDYGFAVVQSGEKKQDTITYTPLSGFTSTDLGMARPNGVVNLVQQLDAPFSKEYLRLFNEAWRDQKDVKERVLQGLSKLFEEHSPELVYYTALYNIFSEYLKDISDDDFADERTGFKSSVIWSKLFDFQKDAALAIINKLERFNGCILADSVGLGKTYTALAVIKYYETRNKSVLVLCPKKLSENWNAFNHNSRNNPLIQDKFRYDVLYHTDLTRMHDPKAYSNGIKLDTLNWENYDLVVIDESHNFRNGGSSRRNTDKQNRYDLLLNEVIRKGVNTKVLMLSATPVNNRFGDLRNQLELAYENGDPKGIEEKLATGSTIQGIFNKAQAAYNKWSKNPPEERTTEHLLKLLEFDFFELLDSVTIARSRKHIRDYYDMSRIGAFPTRLAPRSVAPSLTTEFGFGDYDFFFDALLDLELSIYTPSLFIKPGRREKYADQFKDHNRGFNHENREMGLRRLMAINLMKRMESSIESFRLTLDRMRGSIELTLDKIAAFNQNPVASRNYYFGLDDTIHVSEWDEEDEREENYLSIGKNIKVELADMELDQWEDSLTHDLMVIRELLDQARQIDAARDNKLAELKRIIADKMNNPINGENYKVLIFTAFADTAEYLYENLYRYCRSLGLNTAVVTGSTQGKTSIEGFPGDFNTILTCFSPASKGRDAIYTSGIASTATIDVLIGTDCISEGQNLQDCDLCVNYDIHWNPIRIIQRYGRVDRIGSQNRYIQLVNFWPDASLDKYIDLKRRVESRMIAGFIVNPAEAKVLADENEVELAYRRSQLQKLKNETVDIEDISENISITDLGLNEFRLDLLNFEKVRGTLPKPQKGIYAVTYADRDYEPGVVFVLRNITAKSKVKSQNRMHPYYLVYISTSGKVIYNHLQPKDVLLVLKMFGKQREVNHKATAVFNHETQDGRNMAKYARLLEQSIESMLEVKKEADIQSLFRKGGTTFNTKIDGMNDFEIICYLILK